jgi:hypothetical protein
MFALFRRSTTSLAAVVAAYLVYWVALVPWIEPSAGAKRAADGDELLFAGNAALADWRTLFPEGSWELDQPKTLETDQGLLLIRNYEALGDGQLRLEPCTVIWHGGEDRRKRDDTTRQVVLQAPEGAILQFGGELNLSRGKIGALEGGMLKGPVVIRSPESRPGADDALEFRTRDVLVTRQRIHAPHQVKFRYGRSYGSGRDLIITLGTAEDRGRARGDALNAQVGNLHSLELVHVDRVQLHLDHPPTIDDSGAAATAPKESEDAEVEFAITCRGAFKFNFPAQIATFADQVNIARVSGESPRDSLSCEHLSVYFHGRAADGPDPATASREEDASGKRKSGMSIERIEAKGQPAVLRAPSYGASLNAERFEYNFLTKQVVIEDSHNSDLHYRQYHIQTRKIEYDFGEPGRLGQLRAYGAGRMTGVLPGDEPKSFEAEWNDRVVLQPHEGDHALSLLAGARIRFDGMGEFSAGKLHVWLRESLAKDSQPGKPRYTYLPDRMLAQEQVHVDSVQLAGDAERAEVWVRYEEELPRNGGPADSAAATAAASPLDAKNAKSKYQLQGQNIQAQLVRRGETMIVEHIIVDGEVTFREFEISDNLAERTSILGDIVQVEDADKPHTRVRVQGQPARISARGLEVVGNSVQLDRGYNHVWIAGPGEMVLAGEALASARRSEGTLKNELTGPMRVSWQGRMDFDGRTARFAEQVRLQATEITRSGERHELDALGQQLAVTLTHPVDFSHPRQHPETKLAKAAFVGSVFLQNRGSQAGEPVSYERMQVQNLTIEQTTGQLHADGPGWGSTVRYDSQGVGSGLPGTRAAAKPADREQLVFVRVDFEDKLVGQLEDRQIVFHGRVRTIYGPVAGWQDQLQPDPLDGLTDDQILLSSDQLLVADMGSRTSGEPAAIEMVASGNASIEGREFSAQGWRISYARAKELVVLEGDGRNDAELWMRGSTTPDAAAQQLRFWTNDMSIQVDGGRFLNLGQLGAMGGGQLWPSSQP